MKKSYIIFFLLTLFMMTITFSASAEIVRIISEYANIRPVPDTESMIIGEALEDDIFEFEGEEDNWIKIKLFSGEHRYVHNSLAKVINYSISAPFSNDVYLNLMKELGEAEDKALRESNDKYPLSHGKNIEKNIEYQKILLDRYILDIFHENDLQPVIYQIAVSRCMTETQSEMREFKIVNEKDISIKALGEKKLLDYSAEELEKLPKNIRMNYALVIPSHFSLEKIKFQLAKFIIEKSKANPDIDEIHVGIWESEESFKGGNPDLGYAEWSPYGKWSVTPPEIAINNNRDSYKIVYKLKEKELETIKKRKNETLFGLTEGIRREIFKEMMQCEDWADIEAMQYYFPGCEDCAQFIEADIDKYINKLTELTDSCRKNVRKKYNIAEEIMLNILAEALQKRWIRPEMLPIPACCTGKN